MCFSKQALHFVLNKDICLKQKRLQLYSQSIGWQEEKGWPTLKIESNPQDLSVSMFWLPVLGRQASQQEKGEPYI